MAARCSARHHARLPADVVRTFFGSLQQTVAFDDDAEAEKAVRSRVAGHNAKLKPFIAADPRAKLLIAQIVEAFKIADPRARRAKLTSLSPQILAVRNDAIAKANIKPAELQTDLAPVELLAAIEALRQSCRIVARIPTDTSEQTPCGLQSGPPGASRCAHLRDHRLPGSKGCFTITVGFSSASYKTCDEAKKADEDVYFTTPAPTVKPEGHGATAGGGKWWVVTMGSSKRVVSDTKSNANKVISCSGAVEKAPEIIEACKSVRAYPK